MAFLTNFVEQEGLARTVLAVLLMTTIGCFSYTWGYYEARPAGVDLGPAWEGGVCGGGWGACKAQDGLKLTAAPSNLLTAPFQAARGWPAATEGAVAGDPGGPHPPA